MTSRRAFSLLLCTIVVTSCASTPVRTGPAPQQAGPAAIQTTGTTWVNRSAEYHALVLQAYRHAAPVIEQAVRGKATGSWAVILDADETVISNVQYQLEIERVGQSFNAATWNAWTKRREATPLPGAKAFLDRIRALGGRVAIVTNRLESECADTRAVFEAHALVFDAMLCRPDGTSSDKNPRFAAVAAGTYPGARGPAEVVAWVGDNILDFPALSQAIRQQGDAPYAEFGRRYFVIPNPMYGSWQQ
jgi:5'-nucleotidase (lipoprotein e(P4) family)